MVTLGVVTLGTVSLLTGCGSNPSSNRAATACSLLTPSAAASILGVPSMPPSADIKINSGTECLLNGASTQDPALPVTLGVILYDSQTAVTAFLDGHRPGVSLLPHAPKFTQVTVAGRKAFWWSQTVSGGYTEIQTCKPSTTDCTSTEHPEPSQAGGGLGATVNGYVIQITVQNASEAQAERALAMMLPSLE
jgi:hypothetical protein